MSVKVLFVDDDEANLIVCEAACVGDFEVLTATSAEAAMARCSVSPSGTTFLPGASPTALIAASSFEHAPESA